MRAYVPSYELIVPANLGEVLNLLAGQPGIWKPFAGGTDLMVLLESGKLLHRNYVDILNLKELRGIEITDEYIILGALTTYTEVQAHPVLSKEFPMLCQAASETGGLAIQNRGTLGGNIVNASPAADSPPALLAYDAEVELVATSGSRWIPYSEFHTDYKKMNMHADELLRVIRLPRATSTLRHYYRKVGTRKAQAISKVCFAGVGRIGEGKFADVRIALGSVAPIPLRCIKTEGVINGLASNADAVVRARAELAREIAPIGDIRSTADYRLRVALNVLEDFLVQMQNAPPPQT
jgi:CO/xanthine dehydrogenase FAD-binding subunit